MSTASELFYNWRSRSCRTQPPDHNPPDRDPDLRRARRHRRPRRDDHPVGVARTHAGTPSPAARHLCHRVLQPEREPVRLDYGGGSESGSNNSSSSEAVTSGFNRSRLTRNDRLPGAVLQARERLLERLRGISLARNRQTASSGIAWDDLALGNEFSLIIETSSGAYESAVTFDAVNAEENQLTSIQIGNKNKPPGLSLEAFRSLHQEVYKDADGSDVLVISHECAICLDKFLDGDSLLRLSCGHGFHPACLEPWVLTCGDCPYCRASI